MTSTVGSDYKKPYIKQISEGGQLSHVYHVPVPMTVGGKECFGEEAEYFYCEVTGLNGH